MKFKRWWQKAVDREEWASVIKEAKAVKGSKSQEVSKSFYCFSDSYGYEENRGSIPGREIFLFTTSRLIQGLTQPASKQPQRVSAFGG
jgi:hypothetical protein